MRAHQAEYPVAMMCRLLGVSTSGYYAWRKRGPSARSLSDAMLTRQIKQIHEWSKGTYGAPRVQVELEDRGGRAGHNRIARLMRNAGIQGVTRRKKTFTTRRASHTRPAPDLVDRNFKADGPNTLWVADITYVPTWAGFLYLAVVLDVWSRRVVGWDMQSTLATKLVINALDMALEQRRPDSVIHHSDQGCQYTSIAFGSRCEHEGIRPSMGSVGDCFDNALCESFFATLECELIDRTTFRSHAGAKREIFTFIEGWYNPHRRHSAIGNLSPCQFERRHLTNKVIGSAELSTKPG